MPGQLMKVTLNGTTGAAKVDAWKYEGDRSFAFPVSGEASYQRSLWKIVGKETKGEQARRHEVDAVILPEPDNKFDRNAMRVFIQGQLVGYLARDDAAEMVEEMATTPGRPLIVICRAMINGGFKAKDGSIAHLGVVLDLDFPLTD